MPWWGWVLVGVGVIVVPLLIGMAFASGNGMSGGGPGNMAGIFGPFEEMFHPARRETNQEVEAQKIRKQQAADSDSEDPDAEPDPPDLEPISDAAKTKPGFAVEAPPGWLNGK